MARSFFEQLEARCREIDSLLCVGLDPHASELPRPSAAAAREFCLRLIEQTTSFAAAFKPNSAFFEIYGAEGMQVLQDVIAAVPAGIPVLLDAKRGDIGSTAQAYAQAAFEALGAGAVTVNPYLGSDAIAPFIANPTKAAFLLCKTSNPGAADVQDLPANGTAIYLHVADLARQWNTRGNIGLVVGATYPEVLAETRAAAPELWFLAPGIGAQGGGLEAAVAAGLRTDGLGLLVPISRGISKAASPAKVAEEFRDQLNAAREAKPKTKPRFKYAALADDLLRLGCVTFGEFKLKSGQVSPIYLDLRRLVGDPAALARAAAAYSALLLPLRFDRIAALPYAALPIGTAVSLRGGWPLVYPRKESKDYGTRSAIEGIYSEGETVVVIDDLVTTGSSKFEAIEKLQAAGLHVTDVVVLIDRSGKADLFAERGLKLHAALKLTELLDHWSATHAISQTERQSTLAFLQLA
jgi:uridine monophosphate synthetase